MQLRRYLEMSECVSEKKCNLKKETRLGSRAESIKGVDCDFFLLSVHVMLKLGGHLGSRRRLLS